MQTMTENWVEVTATYTKAWEFFKAHWGGVYKIGIVAFLLIFAVNFTLGIFVGIFGDESLFSTLLTLLGQFWSQFISIGSVIIFLQFIRSNGVVTFSVADFLAVKTRFIPYLLANVRYFLIVLFGYVLFIIPGIIWSMKYAFGPVLVVDKSLGAKEAFDMSAQMTEGIKWQMLGFSLFGILVTLGGLLLLGVGLFLAIPIVYLASYMLYDKLLSRAKLGITG